MACYPALMPSVEASDHASVVRDIDAAGGRPSWLLARGLLPSDTAEGSSAARIGVLEVGDGRPVLRADVWLADDELQRLREELHDRGDVRTGRWDVLFATRWRLAWTDDGEPFALWDRRGRRAEVIDDTLRVRLGSAAHAWPCSDLVAVEVHLAAAWVLREVRITRRDGGPVIVARQREWFAASDPTYDMLELGFDAWWAVELAQELARRLVLPLRIPEPLQ